MSSARRSRNRTALAIGSVIFLAMAAVMGAAVFQKAKAVADETYEFLELFNQVLAIVQRDYVREVKIKDLIYGAIDGVCMTLDPHSQFIPVEDFREMKEDLSGEFGGIGIEVGMKDNRITVIRPLEDTPAWRAGLQAGDWIVEIEGESTLGMKLNDAVHRMRGPVGTPVTIKVMREGWSDPAPFTLIRELIKIKSVKEFKLMKGDIGYIKLVTFTENTTKEMKTALKSLDDQSRGKLKGLVLDLRNNPGGPLDQAINVADLFLTEGVIVTVKGRREGSPPAYAHKAGTFKDVPLIVLANELSASAAEIVAGAIQDHGRGVILGQVTFGKGSVQQLRTLKDGSGLKITTAYYYTPSGRTIQEDGILPDVVVDDLSPEEAAKLTEEEKRKRKQYIREKDLNRHFRQSDITGKEREESSLPAGVTPGAEFLPSTVGQDTDDYQLQRALDLLRSFENFQAALNRRGR